MEKTIFTDFESLPLLLSSHDLVALGLFSSIDAAWQARVRGNSPDFIQFERKILYPKKSVIEFIERNLKKGNSYGQEKDESERTNRNP